MGARQDVDLRSSCFGVVCLAAFLAYLAYTFGSAIFNFWVFVHDPHLGARLLEILGGLGLCLGATILFCVVMVLLPPPKRKDTDEYDDYY